jgi:hypothetical protein
MLIFPAFVLLLEIVSADEDEVDDQMVVRAVVEVYTQHVAKSIATYVDSFTWSFDKIILNLNN